MKSVLLSTFFSLLVGCAAISETTKADWQMCNFRGTGFCLKLGEGSDISISTIYGHDFEGHNFSLINGVNEDGKVTELPFGSISVGDGVHTSQEYWGGFEYYDRAIDGEEVQVFNTVREGYRHWLIKRDKNNVNNPKWVYMLVTAKVGNEMAESVLFNKLKLCYRKADSQIC